MSKIDNSGNKRLLSRRSFINNAAAGSAFIAMGPVSGFFADDTRQSVAWPAEASKFRFHMIGHGHIDPVWLWSWEEGVAVVHSTFRSALDRMNETPGFCFTTSSAQFFKWVAENDPAMLAEIKQRVKEGRWNIVGGWWVEPDMNIPSGEAMVRQGLYGQLTFERLLGKRAVVATNPDSFGHTGNLPQIIAKQGMENYIFMRPGVREKNIPSDLFWWEGPDGTKVLTYRIQQSYNDGGNVRNRLNTVMNQSAGQPMKTFMAYYGVGDHGGGATKETIRSVTDVMAEKGAPKTFFSTADNYFTEVRNDKSLKLPVIKDDLQHHAVGCYTAESEIKKSNRRCEAELVTAEKIAAIGSMVWGAVYPKKDLTSAWERLLFLQFHDSLAGSSLYDHSQAAREGYGFSLDIAHQATWMAMQKLEWQVPAEDPASQYMIVFNPHAWEVKANIEYDFNWGSNHKSSRVEDEKGNHLPHQWTAGSSETGSRRKLIVNAAIPPMGYRQLRLLDGDSQAFGYSVTAGNNTLENDLLKVTFSESGTISIFDKENGREVFAGGASGCKAVIIDDPSDTWSHDIKTYDKEIGKFGNARFTITESGPLRATLRVVTVYGESTLTIDWMLYAGSRNLEARVSLDWHEHLKMLKFSFPVDIDSPVATYESSYGHIVRAANGDEDPGQRWIDVTGQKSGKEYGLTVLNDAKYGYNIKGNDMRISVARSAVYAHHNPKVLDMKAEHLWMDQGIQTLRLLLVPHTGSWKKINIPRLADEFISPPQALYQGIHGGRMAKSGSFISVDSPSVAVTTMKQSEKGDDLIIRCVETLGAEATATVYIYFADVKWHGKFRPCEIKSLRLNRITHEIKEVNLLEE
jgi:alpha-mannosidase